MFGRLGAAGAARAQLSGTAIVRALSAAGYADGTGRVGGATSLVDELRAIGLLPRVVVPVDPEPEPEPEPGPVTPPTVTAEIWLGWGDSLGVGIDARDPAVDLDWEGVFQVRQRTPAGISADISPLDQAIDPTATDFLSPYEYFARQRRADTGRRIYLVPHNFNGSRIIGSGAVWGVGNVQHEAFVARANAAIRTVRAAEPGAIVAGIIQFESTNDRASGGAAAWEAAITPAVGDMRSRIYHDGTGGASIANTAYVIGGTNPEGRTQAPGHDYELASRRLAAITPGGRYLPMPEGIQRGDNIHPTAAGNRSYGAALAAILTDTAAPVITLPAAYAIHDGQRLLLELTGDPDIYSWTLSGAGAADYEIVWLSAGVNGLNYTRIKPYLRWVGDGTRTPGDYSVTVTARDSNGNTASIVHTTTVAPAYGTVVEPVVATGQTVAFGAPVNDGRGRANVPVQLGRGMNVIVLNKASGTAADVASVSFNGAQANRDPNSTATTQIWYLPMPSARAGTLVVTPTSGTFNGLDCLVASVVGTIAAPATSSVKPNASRTTPHLTDALVCPAGGIIIGGGSIGGKGASIAGQTDLLVNGVRFVASRSTDGAIGAVGTNNAFSALGAAAFAKA